MRSKCTNTSGSYCKRNDLFRENVINYPTLSPTDTPDGDRPKVNVTILPPANPTPPANQQSGKQKGLSTSQVMKQRAAINAGAPPIGQAVRPEDKPDTPEYKKKQAMLKGPILELATDRKDAYGMDECTFTGLKACTSRVNKPLPIAMYGRRRVVTAWLGPAQTTDGALLSLRPCSAW